MKRVWSLVACVMIAAWMVCGSAFAQKDEAKKEPAPAAQPAKGPAKDAKDKSAMPRPAANMKSVRGEVKSINAEAKSLVISEKAPGGAAADKTVTLGDKAVVRIDGKPSELKDLKVGDKVNVRLATQDGKELGVSVRVYRQGPAAFDKATSKGAEHKGPAVKEKKETKSDKKDAKEEKKADVKKPADKKSK